MLYSNTLNKEKCNFINLLLQHIFLNLAFSEEIKNNKNDEKGKIKWMGNSSWDGKTTAQFRKKKILKISEN